jgi:hypothetical protein
LLPVYLARRRRNFDVADADADEDNEGEVLEVDAEVQKRRKTEDAVAAMKVVAEDVRMESDSGAFLVGPCYGEDPEDGNEDYDEYNVENNDGYYEEERLEDEEDNNNEDNYPPLAEAAVSIDVFNLESQT